MGGQSYSRTTSSPDGQFGSFARANGVTPRFITYASRGEAPDLATLAFLLDAAGLPARPGVADEPVMLAHGPHPVQEGGLRIPLRPTDDHWSELAAGTLNPGARTGELPVDLVAVVAAHLDDRVHRSLPDDALDAHGRLRARASFGARMGTAGLPIVNRAVELIADIGRQRFGVAPLDAWPSGRRAAVGLSHDVDLPERYAMARDLARPWRFRRAPRTQLNAALRLARERLVDTHPDDHWAFDDLMAMEDRAGVRSTFLFSVTPYHAPWGSTLDPAYDAARPRFMRLYERLREGRWEIGLHAGYRAFEDPARLVAERQRLSDLAGVEVRGLRHHYWQLGPDVAATLRAHEGAGFAYDASLAFNDAPGYRRGIALPFHPYDATMQRPLHTLQLPTTLMDGNLFYRSLSVDEAVRETIEQVEVIRSLGGLAVIDWHAHTAVSSNHRFRAWGEAYERILDWLAGQPELWVTTLDEIAEWRRRRSAELQRLAETT